MESVKKAVIKESLARIKKRLAEIQEIMDARPLSDMLKFNVDFQNAIKGRKLSEVSEAEIDKFDARRKAILSMAKKQEKMSDLIDERVSLELEEGTLKTELYYLERRL